MKGISAGSHSIKVEFQDLFSLSSAIKEETIEYISVDKKAGYRKIPLTKKISGSDFDVVSISDKKIYLDIERTKKNELNSEQDKW